MTTNDKHDGMTDFSETLTPREAAKRLRCSVSTLRCWREEGKGPASVKMGRSIRYEPAVIDAWLKTVMKGEIEHPERERAKQMLKVGACKPLD